MSFIAVFWMVLNGFLVVFQSMDSKPIHNIRDVDTQNLEYSTQKQYGSQYLKVFLSVARAAYDLDVA
jgi:hypothetical protein